jgi:hypothetical protein
MGHLYITSAAENEKLNNQQSIISTISHLNSLTNSMEQSPSSEADGSQAGQVIPGRLCNPKIHCRI